MIPKPVYMVLPNLLPNQTIKAKKAEIKTAMEHEVARTNTATSNNQTP